MEFWVGVRNVWWVECVGILHCRSGYGRADNDKGDCIGTAQAQDSKAKGQEGPRKGGAKATAKATAQQ